MLTDLFGILGGTAFIAGNAIKESIKNKESEKIITENLINHDNIIRDARIDWNKFIKKYVNQEKEYDYLAIVKEMRVNEKHDYLINGIRLFLPKDDIKADSVILKHLDIDKCVKNIMLAKEGIIGFEEAYYNWKSCGYYHKGSKKIDEWWKVKWIINHAFTKWLDFELQKNDIEPMLFVENGNQSAFRTTENDINQLRKKMVLSSDYNPAPEITYYWWSTRNNIFY